METRHNLIIGTWAQGKPSALFLLAKHEKWHRKLYFVLGKLSEKIKIIDQKTLTPIRTVTEELSRMNMDITRSLRLDNKLTKDLYRIWQMRTIIYQI